MKTNFAVRTLSFPLLVLALGNFIVGCGVEEPNRPDGPVADFTWKGKMRTDGQIDLINLSVNADRFRWRFPNGAISSQINPSTIIYWTGKQPVTLIAYNTETSREDSLTREILIHPGSVYLDSVIVEGIPFNNRDGASWDELTGPDLYFVLHRPGNYNETWSFDYVFNDCQEDQLPIGWHFTNYGYYLPDWNFNYQLDIIDKDTRISAPDYNEIIGIVHFRVRDLTGNDDYDKSITLISGSTKVRIVVRWE